MAPERPAFQALRKKFHFWLCTVGPYVIQSWERERDIPQRQVQEAGRGPTVVGGGGRGGAEHPALPVSGFSLIRG